MALDDRTNAGGDPTGPLLFLLSAACLYGAGIWAGARANIATHPRPYPHLPTNLVARAAVSIWNKPGDPAAAFAPTVAPSITNPALFWAVTAATWILGIILAIGIVKVFTGGRNVGQKRRQHFGAPAWSVIATRRDLVTLAVRGPVVGRTIFGTSNRLLLATEDRHQPVRRSTRRPHPRQGDRGAILGVGPARSGKSQVAISAILEHDWTPAICSSVKTDLIAATVRPPTPAR